MVYIIDADFVESSFSYSMWSIEWFWQFEEVVIYLTVWRRSHEFGSLKK